MLLYAWFPLRWFIRYLTLIVLLSYVLSYLKYPTLKGMQIFFFFFLYFHSFSTSLGIYGVPHRFSPVSPPPVLFSGPNGPRREEQMPPISFLPSTLVQDYLPTFPSRRHEYLDYGTYCVHKVQYPRSLIIVESCPRSPRQSYSV